MTSKTALPKPIELVRGLAQLDIEVQADIAAAIAQARREGRAEGKAEGFREGVEKAADIAVELEGGWIRAELMALVEKPTETTGNRFDSVFCPHGVAATNWPCLACASDQRHDEATVGAWAMSDAAPAVVTPAASDSAQAEREKYEPTSEQIKQLREETGAGMADCREMLMKAHGDMPLAAYGLRHRGIAVHIRDRQPQWYDKDGPPLPTPEKDNERADALDLDELARVVERYETSTCSNHGTTCESCSVHADDVETLLDAAPELIRRAREREQLAAELDQACKSRSEMHRRAQKAERERDEARDALEAYRASAKAAPRSVGAERAELRALVAEVADDATVNLAYGEISDVMHLECSDCCAEAPRSGKVEHDETCIVSRARAALAKVGGGA